MKKLIKILIYMDTDEENMPAIIKDVKHELSIINYLHEKYGLFSIKVTITGFDKDTGWGWETVIK